MKLLLVNALIILSFYEIYGAFPNFYTRILPEKLEGNPGEPLILTPLIEQNKIKEAQSAAEVFFDGFKKQKSYSGYFTVDKHYDSNMFFWYFPAQVGSENAPVVLWLQGGPGASSLIGLFAENGPFSVAHRGLKIRKYSWTQNHNVIYIDNPVGTGYSFTSKGYAQNETKVGEDLYSALVQFFTLFPDLQKNDFFLSGESYGGKYVPAIAHTIHQKNPSAKLKINLQGISIGNGLSDPIHQLKYGDYLYQLGLIDTNALKIVQDYEARGVKYIQNKQFDKAFDIFDTLLNGDFNNHTSLFKNITGFDNYFNYLYPVDPTNLELQRMGKYIQRDDVRAAIHVGNTTFNDITNVVEKEQLLPSWNCYQLYFSMRNNLTIFLSGLRKRVLNTTKRCLRLIKILDLLFPKMRAEILLMVLLAILFTTESFQKRYPKILISKGTESGDDPGIPLLLTPLIEQGKIDDAQMASEVYFDGFLKKTSYAGFFTVDKTFSSNLFFWYFPSENDFEHAPIILWLQGGPGDTSLIGLFAETGPFSVKIEHGLRERVFAWTKTHSVIYIDNPVGTGFSFTDGGYAQNQTKVGEDLYEALIQFFTVFPDLQSRDFYVSGESYAGKYVPAIAYTIHQKNPTAKFKINLKGLTIGSGYSDPINQLEYGDYLYQIGLYDANTRDQIKQLELQGIQMIQNKEWEKAARFFDTLMNGDLSNSSFFKNVTGFQNYFNYINAVDPVEFQIKLMETYIQRNDVRAAMHVGNATFHDDNTVENNLIQDLVQSVAPWISELLNYYRVLIYNGQLDILVPYPLTLNYLQKLSFSGADEYKQAIRYQWKVDGNIAGYVKQAGNLTEIMVRDAGHMVPTDQPQWAFDMINRFTSNKPFH